MPRKPKGERKMYLEEYAEAINQTLHWTYQHHRINHERRYTVNLRHSCVQGGGVERHLYGAGPTPETAKDDYVRKIRGQRLTFNNGSVKEFDVPSNLEG